LSLLDQYGFVRDDGCLSYVYLTFTRYDLRFFSYWWITALDMAVQDIDSKSMFCLSSFLLLSHCILQYDNRMLASHMTDGRFLYFVSMSSLRINR